MMEGELRPVSQNNRPLDHVGELAHVAGPRICH
jgi:hypothetical protein